MMNYALKGPAIEGSPEIDDSAEMLTPSYGSPVSRGFDQGSTDTDGTVVIRSYKKAVTCFNGSCQTTICVNGVCETKST